MAAARNALVMGALTLPLLAAAGSGQIDSFSSDATSVVQGTTVQFTGSVSVFTSTFSDGGSDLVEPLPIEGSQSWLMNWYRSEEETLRSVHLSAAGSSFSSYLFLAPGSSYSDTWNFWVPFFSPGQFSVTLSGSWESDVRVYYSSETATRDCMNVDPGGSNELVCSSWQYSYSDYADTFSSGGAFASQTINIDVTAAPVPEPAQAMLWLLGLASLLGGSSLARRRSRDVG